MTQLELPHTPPPPDTLERLQADVLALEGEFLGASMNQRTEFDIRARVDALRVSLAALDEEVRRLRFALAVERRTSDRLLDRLLAAEEKLERIAELAC